MLLPKSGIDVKSKNKPVKGDKGGKGGEGAGKKKEEKYNRFLNIPQKEAPGVLPESDSDSEDDYLESPLPQKTKFRVKKLKDFQRRRGVQIFSSTRRLTIKFPDFFIGTQLSSG